MMKNIKKVCKYVVSVILMLLVLSPASVCAEEAQTATDSEYGELVDVEDYGDGWVSYQYVSYDDAQEGIQLYSIETRKATKTAQFYYEDEYVFTVKQEVTFTFNNPEGYAIITSAKGYILEQSDSSQYEPGTLKTFYDSTSTSTYVYSSTGIYKKSDGSKVRAVGVILYCRNDGSVQ